MNFNKKVVFAFGLLLNITYICAKAHSKCGEDEERLGVPGGLFPTCDSKTLDEVETHAEHAVSQLKDTDGSTCTFKDIVEPTSKVEPINLSIIYYADVHHNCGGHEKKCLLKIVSHATLPEEPDQLSWECDEYKNHEISKHETPGYTPLEDLTKATELARQETKKQPGCQLVKVKSGDSSQNVQGKMYHLKTEVTCNNQKRECYHKIVERVNHEIATKKFNCKNI